MSRRPTHEEWKRAYKSVSEEGRQKLDRLVRELSRQNQRQEERN